MTALAGFWSSGATDPRRAVFTMLEAQRAYAPDNGPVVGLDGEVALGRRLFHTLPEDQFDDGPVVGGGGRYRLIADLRLDDRAGIGARCGLAPAELATLADAALVMRLVERDGAACLADLLGDFAIALWDRQQRALTLARDFAGMRPLHYHHGRAGFAVASMPQGLHCLPFVPRAPDRDYIADLLALAPESGPRSVFANINRVEPGHIVTIAAGRIEHRRYWAPRPAPPPENPIEGLRAEVDRAVHARLRRTTPGVAAQLSGGLDSGMVVATAARFGVPVTALTAAPRENRPDTSGPSYFGDEAPLAAMLASTYPAIDHIVVRSSGRSPVATLDRQFDTYQHPIPNLSNVVWLDDLAAAAQQRGQQVLLSGSAGNLAFSRDGMDGLAELLTSGAWIALARLIRSLRDNQVAWRSIAAGIFRPVLRPRDWHELRDTTPWAALAPAHAARIRRERRWRQRPPAGLAERQLAARLSAFERVDRGWFNAGLRATWGLDLRDPLADRRLVEYCLSLRPQDVLFGGRRRGVARVAAADRMPAASCDESRRGLQGTDWDLGFMADRPTVSALITQLVHQNSDPIDASRVAALFMQMQETDLTAGTARASYRGTMSRALSAGHFVLRASA